MRRFFGWVLAAVMTAATTACLDLNVVNENNPDIERALQDPADVEQVIASAFQIWFTPWGINNATMVYPVLADEATNTRVHNNFQWSQEPRLPLPNDPLDNAVWIPRLLWDNYAECIANTNDGLRRIKAGLIIETLNPGATDVTDNTDRAYTYAKLLQGICISYYALSMDKFAVATEDSVIPEGFDDQLAWEREHWKDYTEAVPVAIRSLEQAIDRATTGDAFLTPTTWQNLNEYNNATIIQVAHTSIARLLVYLPRTPEERAQVDWQKVLFHTERGLTTDWGLTLQTGVLTANNWLNNLQTTANSSTRLLADNHLLGPADNSGNYQAYLALPIEQRDRFTITTPDRRITGTTPTSSGAYFRYSATTTALDPARGLYNFSYYQWYRRTNELNCTGGCGFFGLITAVENRLLRAEALYRTGNLQGAVDLINVSRTKQVKIGTAAPVPNLPPVTVAGVPTVNGQCVPRKKSGACGDLLDALKWERAIELAGQDPLRSWFDFRGFGQLQPGTLLHMPIPGRYLVSHGLPVYTYGGVGGDGAAR